MGVSSATPVELGSALCHATVWLGDNWEPVLYRGLLEEQVFLVAATVLTSSSRR